MRHPLAAVVVATLLTGCASALRAPPPVDALGERTGGGETASPGEVAGLLAAATTAWARRPDAVAVARARELFLAAARADAAGVDGLLGAAVAGAWLIEHEADAGRRAALATADVQICQWCGARAPDRIDCDYRLALALGQQARERPATAADALPRITALLAKVMASAPRLDEAGGYRVLALVLLRAPGWPIGPGDPELGLERARQAVALVPEYPPNLLALGEALSVAGNSDEAVATYERAGQLAEERITAGDPDAREWADQARRSAAALR